MPIFSKSRYSTAKLYKVPDTSNYQVDNRTFLKLEDFQNWDVVAVDEKDRIEIIAYQFYGDERLWWVIADVNNIAFPLEIERGQKLFIPSLDEVNAILEDLRIS